MVHIFWIPCATRNPSYEYLVPPVPKKLVPVAQGRLLIIWVQGGTGYTFFGYPVPPGTQVMSTLCHRYPKSGYRWHRKPKIQSIQWHWQPKSISGQWHWEPKIMNTKCYREPKIMSTRCHWVLILETITQSNLGLIWAKSFRDSICLCD